MAPARGPACAWASIGSAGATKLAINVSKRAGLTFIPSTARAFKSVAVSCEKTDGKGDLPQMIEDFVLPIYSRRMISLFVL